MAMSVAICSGCMPVPLSNAVKRADDPSAELMPADADADDDEKKPPNQDDDDEGGAEVLSWLLPPPILLSKLLLPPPAAAEDLAEGAAPRFFFPWRCTRSGVGGRHLDLGCCGFWRS